MKKILILIGGLVLLLVVAAATYYYFFQEPPNKTRPKRDTSGMIVQPTKHSMKDYIFVVPGSTDQIVLSLSFSVAIRDYPMGRFTQSGSTTKDGQLVAMDNFATDLANNLQAVPISVVYAGEQPEYYLAIIRDDGTTKTHTSSLPLGPNLTITSVTREGDSVSVTYQAHTKAQSANEPPSVNTTAMVDIGRGLFTQEGRKPWLETIEAIKIFAGAYTWRETKQAGDSIITPSVTDVFTLTFDANRIILDTDCNTGGATFITPIGSTTALAFSDFSATSRFCESKEEGPYFDMIKNVTAFTEDANGTISFTLKDGATMIFEPKVKPLQFEATASSPTSLPL